MEGFTIRDYKEEDFEAVMKLWEQTGMGSKERGDDKDTIERCLEKGGRMLILEQKQEKKLTGTSWMTFDGRRIHLHHFGILPEFQGKGLSRYLLEKTLAWVRETGYQVKLEVHASNKAAINLYKKYGFKYLGDYRIYIIRDINYT